MKNNNVTVYLTGRYADSKLSYAVCIDLNGRLSKISGIIEKSRNEAQISATGVLLKYLETKEYNAVINTTFRNAAELSDENALASGEQEEKYRTLLSDIRKKTNINIIYTENIPSDIENKLFPEQHTIPYGWNGRKPYDNYRVTVFNPDNTVLCDVNQKDFSDRNSALYFAYWYLQESKNPDSIFYGCKVHQYGLVPSGKVNYE